jgi:predicted translin family RNA/ssDNA-binding protein
MWIHPSSVEALCAAHQEAGQAGRAIAGRATEAQALAKRVQFALHRRDHDAAQALMDQVEELYQGLARAYPPERLQAEAAWRSLQEEWLESQLFFAFLVRREAFVLPTDLPEACIGALSDVLGEVVRILVRDAAEGSFARLADARELADEVLETLLLLDGTGHARQKIDQARSHARKIEDIAYDAALHGRV